MRRGGVAVWRAARSSQTVQVGHDHHGRLPKVNGQVIILRQSQVAQKTLIWTQRGCEDLQITAISHKVLISLIVKQEQRSTGILRKRFPSNTSGYRSPGYIFFERILLLSPSYLQNIYKKNASHPFGAKTCELGVRQSCTSVSSSGTGSSLLPCMF